MNTAFAADFIINTNLPGTNPSSTGISGLISNFYGFALAMAGILAFGAIVYGGIKYAAGAGNPSSQSEGKSWITNALLGLLLLAGAWIVLYTVNPTIVSMEEPGLPALNPVAQNPVAGTGPWSPASPPQNTSQVDCVNNCYLPNRCTEGPPNFWSCNLPANTSPGGPVQCPPNSGVACAPPNLCKSSQGLFDVTWSCMAPSPPPPAPTGQPTVCNGSGVTCNPPKVCKTQNLPGVFPPGWQTCEGP